MIYLAIVMITGGLALRLAAYCALGVDFQEAIQVPSRVVTTGPYKYVKHPSYWGSMLVICGLSIIDPVLGIMALAWAFYKSRMVVEDLITKR